MRNLDNGDKIDALVVDFSKAFDLVLHGRLLTKIANSGVDSRVVVWIREFFRSHAESGWEGNYLKKLEERQVYRKEAY